MTDKRGTTEERSKGEMMAGMGGERGGDPERQTVLDLFKPRDFLDYLWQLISLHRCAAREGCLQGVGPCVCV